MKRLKAAESGFNVAPTWLSQSQVKQAEYAFQAMENAGFFEDIKESSSISACPRFDSDKSSEEFGKAIAWLVENYKPAHRKPTVSVFWDHFIEKQRKSRISDVTMRDYKRSVGAFVETHRDTRITSLKREEISNYINSFTNSCTRYSVHGYMNAFFNFCCGKHNSTMPEEDWLDRNPINWKKERYDVGEIASYTYSEVETLIKAAKKHGSLGYTIMRLYSMMRHDELDRFVRYGGEYLNKNPFINWETGTIHLNNKVYKKRNRSEHRGRFIKMHPTFRKWLEYLRDENISIKRNPIADKNTRMSVPEKFGKSNIWRHTSLTFYTKHTGNIAEVAYEAGTSEGVMRQSYLNMNIDTVDAQMFFKLNPKNI